MNLLNQFLFFTCNSIGYKTKRKIIVIESDDWGSIRMPSMQAFEQINKKGLDTSGASLRYNIYDTLADKNDLMLLFETLFSFCDAQGSHPVFTALSVVANPDFIKIRESEFNEYRYELFTTTLDRYYGSDNPFYLWMEGIKSQIFLPQFHGREHLNVAVWMKDLKQNDFEARIAFEQGCWGFNNKHPYGISYQAAFELYYHEELVQQASIIEEGLNLFEKLFGYRASYFVPPNGPFNNHLEALAAVEGIRFMYSNKLQYEPQGKGKIKKRFHYIGQQNKYGQYYLTRNCFFEPSEQGKDWVDSCLRDIDNSFKWHKPAIISSHRVNYIGARYPSNRDSGLRQLKTLLYNILNKWPDVEFMTSDALGELIAQDQ